MTSAPKEGCGRDAERCRAAWLGVTLVASDRDLLRTRLHPGSRWTEDRDRRFVVLGEIQR
jgi:hypothetical protein